LRLASCASASAAHPAGKFQDRGAGLVTGQMQVDGEVGQSESPDLAADVVSPTTFAGGAGLLLINPKGWAMAFGAAASFSMLASGPLQLALLLGSALGFAAAVSLSTVVWGQGCCSPGRCAPSFSGGC
jgi:hypothetical protein